MDTLASLVENGYLGNRLTRQEREQAELERDPATGLTKRQRGEYVGDAPDGTAIGNGLRL